MPRYRRWIWWLFWGILLLVRPLLCRIKVEGREHIPLVNGGVVASNHNYGPDFLFLAIASPRELSFMAKAEVFAWHPLLAAILNAAGVFPVRRGQGDNGAIENAVELARQGNLIAMFPEGTRSKDGALMRGRSGAARIALAAGVPIIPAMVTNSAYGLKRRGWRRPLVTVRFGPPIAWQMDEPVPDDDGEIARAYTEVVMAKLHACCHRSYVASMHT